jgi:cupin fold WbuC family metalloprotein
MKKLIEDKKAKSKSFFLKDNYKHSNYKMIKFLEKIYIKTKKDLRICLHENSLDKHHDMIILQQKKNFYLPHKHLKKGETYHIIKGSMASILFNNNGKIKKIIKLVKDDIFRTPLNTYHTMLPLTKFVIYHESKIGPFLKKNDSIFPKWNYKFNNNLEINAFKKKVMNSIR